MTIFRNHNAAIALCHGAYACVLAARGEIAGAIFYGSMAATHALAARSEVTRHSDSTK